MAELSVGISVPQMAMAFVANCLATVIAAAAMRKFMEGPPWFGSLRNALLYVLIAAIVGPAILALGGAFLPGLESGVYEDYWSDWLQWYAANALGNLTLGPVALVFLTDSQKIWAGMSGRKKIEAALVASALVIVCTFAFRYNIGGVGAPYLPVVFYLPLPFALWSAVRFGAGGAGAAILIVTAVAIWRTLNGPSPFISEDVETTVLSLQIFLIGIAISLLLLGASIDELHSIQHATRANEELISFAAAAADLCLWRCDRKTGNIWITNYGRGLFGFAPEQLITSSLIVQSIHPEDRESALDHIRLATESGGPVDSEFRIVRADGTIRWLRARAHAEKDSEEKPALVGGTFSDITERKIAEREASQQRTELTHLMRVSMLGELSGGIVHELTQPLTAILSNAQAARVLVDANRPNLVEVAEVLDDIIYENNRAGEVIHRMRGLLKKGETKFEPVDLNDLIKSTLSILHSELINRRVRSTSELTGTLPLISGDRVQLQQVLLNLVLNAADSMHEMAPTRRMMTIRTNTSREGYIEILVIDRGKGMSPPEIGQVFQPFFSTKDRGLGLGLSICTSIIKAHDGTISLTNNPDGGATASFRLPIQG